MLFARGYALRIGWFAELPEHLLPILFSTNSRAEHNGNGVYDFLAGSTFMHDNAQKS
jgi:hypothetical protein